MEKLDGSGDPGLSGEETASRDHLEYGIAEATAGPAAVRSWHLLLIAGTALLEPMESSDCPLPRTTHVLVSIRELHRLPVMVTRFTSHGKPGPAPV